MIFGYILVFFARSHDALYKLLPLFFPPKFQDLLRENQGNMLNLMACGSVATVGQSNVDIQAFSEL